MKPLLDERLDELAASAHAGLIPRVAACVVAAAVFAFIVPWRLSLAWAGVALALEALGWFSTRRQYLRLPVGWRMRLWDLVNFALASLAWVWLGAVAWTSGSAAGALCAVVIWLAVLFFAQSSAYQSPLGLVVGGLIPGAAVLAVVIFAPHQRGLAIAPFLAVLAIGFAFAGDGLIRALAVRRRLGEAQARVSRSEALYRVLADNVTDVISLNDVSGRRLYMSPSAARALGFTLDELYRKPVYDYIFPDDRESLMGEVAAWAETGEGPLTVQYRVVRSDGEVIWVETTFTLVGADDDAAPPQVVSVARNIQRRKELESQLIEARVQAEAAAAAKSDFLANMTHELRTPLNAIIGFAGVLRRSPRLAAEDARHVGLICDAGATLLGLVNSVLDFSRLEAGAAELDPAPLDPMAEAGSVVELLSGEAAAKGLELSLRSRGAGLVSGDAVRLRQVLLNFVSNAIKFTAEGSVTLSVELVPAGEGAMRLRAEVADTGIGIPEAQLAQVFERFTQADVSVSRRFGGTGLGLAICKRIVELMGGRIGAQSVDGEGSTFWLELTLPTAEALAAPAPILPPAAPQRPVRLLLAEDVAVNRELVKTVLSPFDIEIDTAEDGVAAIEAFRRGAYDLVLMDVQMPVMDGLTATRRIRALPTPAAASTPIVAMTANVLPDQIARCLEAGMDGHLGKPMNPAELLGAIAYWTSHGRSAPPLAQSA